MTLLILFLNVLIIFGAGFLAGAWAERRWGP